MITYHTGGHRRPLFILTGGRSRPLFILFGLLAIVAVAGCTTPARAPEPGPSVTRTDTLRLTGRFAMTQTEIVPEEKQTGASGLFVVERGPNGLWFELTSPLGQTIARANRQPGREAQLYTQDGRRFAGPTLEAVFQEALGMRLPLERLPQWLEGQFERVLERSPDATRIRAQEGPWRIDRRGHRWNIVRDEGNRRLEIRVVTDDPS